MAQYVTKASFVATGAGTFSIPASGGGPLPLIGPFNFTITGTFVATIELQRSFDSGVTFVPVSIDAAGTAADYTAPVSIVCHEPEMGVLYRAYCTAWTSGTAIARLSQ